MSRLAEIVDRYSDDVGTANCVGITLTLDDFNYLMDDARATKELRDSHNNLLKDRKKQYGETLRLRKSLYDVIVLMRQNLTLDGLSQDACIEIVEFINKELKGADDSEN
ncbi:hypothetical protein [Amphibacillus xylanus]|uniref:Uncharacterized protein n=1 Tax=Amphibacillus xylanus (strain ATCC 51415 / DSM 6626 / JCM 7361 / LMG 17667 / NBRC 15112 / Ep01) TaxID=698758 RepID=K0IV73_AMPXN|nr:hypothetical protein [Amphibacillus xylanus]BAM46319.1 hypothetical protein AXY_01870 [Amphibacillus xylanus NBRC 15112]